MRELKFRAYDSATGKVSEPFDVKESWGDYLIDFGDYSTDGALDSIIWEQYTGLEDKNGKEIYEGDIVKKPVFGGDYLVEIVNFNETEAQFQAGVFLLINVEIIGNIHENPELIGGE